MAAGLPFFASILFIGIAEGAAPFRPVGNRDWDEKSCIGRDVNQTATISTQGPNYRTIRITDFSTCSMKKKYAYFFVGYDADWYRIREDDFEPFFKKDATPRSLNGKFAYIPVNNGAPITTLNLKLLDFPAPYSNVDLDLTRAGLYVRDIKWLVLATLQRCNSISGKCRSYVHYWGVKEFGNFLRKGQLVSLHHNVKGEVSYDWGADDSFGIWPFSISTSADDKLIHVFVGTTSWSSGRDELESELGQSTTPKDGTHFKHIEASDQYGKGRNKISSGFEGITLSLKSKSLTVRDLKWVALYDLSYKQMVAYRETT